MRPEFQTFLAQRCFLLSNKKGKMFDCATLLSSKDVADILAPVHHDDDDEDGDDDDADDDDDDDDSDDDENADGDDGDDINVPCKD